MKQLKSFSQYRLRNERLHSARTLSLSAAMLIGIQSLMPAMAEQQPVSTSKSVTEIRELFHFFHTPANVVQIQVANDKTLYAWQNMSAFQYTMQIERDRKSVV